MLHIADWCVCIMVAYFTEISPFLWKFCSCNNIFLFKTHFCSPLRRLYTVRKTFRTCQQISFFCCLTVLTLIKTAKAGGKLLFHLFLLFPNIFLLALFLFFIFMFFKAMQLGNLATTLSFTCHQKATFWKFSRGVLEFMFFYVDPLQ